MGWRSSYRRTNAQAKTGKVNNNLLEEQELGRYEWEFWKEEVLLKTMKAKSNREKLKNHM